RPDAPPWLPASLVARLSRHDWPGNVRQLRNVVRQLVVRSRGAATLDHGPMIERLLRPTPSGHRIRVEAGETPSARAPVSAGAVPSRSSGIQRASGVGEESAPASSRLRSVAGWRKPSDVSEAE